ncbi:MULTISPECIES: hypothetical protein [Myxococcus]|uniref:Uncharacterized protein n=1 Tax=Myxococcus xanthus TaxID=34 RepID=A0AAE6G578_MYXXA|nr:MULTISPECIES: hypothetical protein [Myxococcus]QDE71141.1 hypothetical protein BHS09_31520 [Myxococcus xanthus]QDE78421.1 hypothetical protein BHS08_31540 [Myxococcus xanthus]QDE85800.1 hypothetical protein BHS07_32100 [Myxococcus xanthus]QDE99965.1 hypothetical protein BHS05_31355 [Myxococcus xanthus]WAM25339.1 hypothetical protein OZ403_33210 [Myxococcus sp. NMCA1]
MYIPCRDPFGHRDDFDACLHCGVNICTVCNAEGECGEGCAEALEMDLGADHPHEVQVFEVNNHGDLDALVVYDEYLYGYIRDIEREDSKGVPYFHVIFECIDQQWFGQLHDDLRDMPRWNTAGQDSKFCIVDLTVSANVLRDIVTAIDGDAPYFFPGNWVEMVVNRNDDPRDNRPLAAVDIHFVPQGATNPALAGLSGVIDSRWFMRGIARVPDTPWALRKLMRLSRIWQEG